MNLRQGFRRLLAMFMAAAVCFCFLPRPARAAEEIPDGQYVIWNPAYGVALSSVPDGDYFGAVAYGNHGETEIWTVTNQDDGTITISFGGENLSLSDGYGDMHLGEVNDRWVLEDLGDGTYRIANSILGSCICYAAHENWVTAQEVKEGEEACFALRFTSVTSEESEPAETTTETTETTETTTGATEVPETTEASETTESAGGATGSAPEPEQPVTTAYGLYFGQLHAHTDISDGAGSVEEAFAYAAQVEGLDFLAVTDHSNSFDNANNGVLSDGSVASEKWSRGHAAAANVTGESFVGIYGFEMTWNNGLGHINTFNTPGWQSRGQAAYRDPETALHNYYEVLQTVPGSISQFNHPGDDYGDFLDFAYDEGADSVINLIEVGSGEGAVGTGAYAPAYDYYTCALDKGWHVAPTNSQNNHAGSWGDADTGRTVVLACSLTASGLYEAMQNRRVYATEDSDLQIYYTLNGSVMGSILDTSNVAEMVCLTAGLYDPTDGSIGTVEVIVNGGVSIASRTVTAARETVSFTVPSGYDYYYLRITQPDGNIAVTAPVWTETVETVGISGFQADSEVCTAGKSQAFSLELFNKGESPFDGTVEITDDSGAVLHSETIAVPAEGRVTVAFDYIFQQDGVYTLTATLRGEKLTVAKTLQLTALPENITSQVIVDGTHSGGTFANMTTVAAEQNIHVHVERSRITPAMLEDCRVLIIPAPDRDFEEDFIKMVVEFSRTGGNVLLCGDADGESSGAAARINALLDALGSTMTLADDTAYDSATNGGRPTDVVSINFNEDSLWVSGIGEGQRFLYRGASVDPGEGTWLIRGLNTTFSIDGDGDGLDVNGETYTEINLDDTDSQKKATYNLVKNAGDVYFLACEQRGDTSGTVFLSGGAFLADEFVQTQLKNQWALPYANRTIWENLLGITRTLPRVTPIADVRAAEDGSIFLIQGRVTAGTHNPNTTFPETIYLQDDTGGIAARPYSTHGLSLGELVRIVGRLETQNGEKFLNIQQLEILDSPKELVVPQLFGSRLAMNHAVNGGKLLKVQGEVAAVTLTADGQGVLSFTVKDDAGELATVFVGDTIFSGSTGKNELASYVKPGYIVSAVGLGYLHPQMGAVLRVRDCDEEVLLWHPGMDTGGNPTTGDVFPMELYLTIMLVSLGAMTLLLRRKNVI